MTFSPILPATGNVGWIVLSRTQEQQKALYAQRPDIGRFVGIARAKLPKIENAAQLVANRELLGVVLGAFGLEQDINNRFFIQKVLEEGTIDPASFANRLSDRRYRAMSEAFAFDLTPPNTALSAFADRIVDAYQQRSFESAVGDIDGDLRLALSLNRELSDLVGPGTSADAVWYGVLGTPPLRTIFEKAFRLPSGMSGVAIDRQLEVLKTAARRELGSDDPRLLLDPARQDQIIRKFLLAGEISGTYLSNSASVALSLLQSAPVFNALNSRIA